MYRSFTINAQLLIKKRQKLYPNINHDLSKEDKVKWVKEVGINKKVILVSLKDWEDKQEVMGKRDS